MDDLFNQYREETTRSAPPDLVACVMSRLEGTRIGTPSLCLVLSSSAGLAAAIAFTVTLLASDDLPQPPPTATLFKGNGGGIVSVRP